MSGPGAFTQLVPEHLGAIAGLAARPRARRALDVPALACELAGEADWRTGRLPGFSRRSWGRRHRRGYWRLRQSLEALAQAGVLTEKKGEAFVDLDRLRHQRGEEDGPPFVQLLPGAVEAFASEHGLSRLEADVLCDLVLASGPTGLVGATSQDALARRWGAAWATAHGALCSLARAGAVSAPFCRGQRVTLAVTAKAALVRPAPASPPRRRERHRSAQPRGEADQAAARIWSHFHLGGPPPGALVAVTRRAVRDGAPPAGIVERVVAEGPLTGLRDMTAGLVARVKRAAQAYEEARRQALEDERRRAEAEAALAARVAEEARADAQAASDSRYVASLVPLEALARIGGLADAPGGRLGLLLAEGKVLDWARRAVAAKPGLPKEAALAYYLVHEPPPGPAPPIGADAAGPGVAEALSALTR